MRSDYQMTAMEKTIAIAMITVWSIGLFGAGRFSVHESRQPILEQSTTDSTQAKELHQQFAEIEKSIEHLDQSIKASGDAQEKMFQAMSRSIDSAQRNLNSAMARTRPNLKRPNCGSFDDGMIWGPQGEILNGDGPQDFKRVFYCHAGRWHPVDQHGVAMQ